MPTKSRIIENQVRLSLAVAMGVVLQGIRIRLGRSVVTLTGVVLGIAFLMSILTGQIIRNGVSNESALRAEVNRMLSFLTAETGPLRDRQIAILQVGPLQEIELRLIRLLAEQRLTELRWLTLQAYQGAASSTQPPAQTILSTPDQLTDQVSSLIIMGDGSISESELPGLLEPARQKLVAFTRISQLPQSASAISLEASLKQVMLEREMRPEEQARLDKEASIAAVRDLWIIIVSLLVTTIGIANAMLMSVTERFREIGTMKCLGALSSFIRQIFLIESSLMGLVGAFLGSVVGALFALFAYAFTFGPGLVFGATDLFRVVLYLLLCVAVGVLLSIVAAIYPANIAAKMVPAVALRSNV